MNRFQRLLSISTCAAKPREPADERSGGARGVDRAHGVVARRERVDEHASRVRGTDRADDAGPERKPPDERASDVGEAHHIEGRGLHSSTSQLNLSRFW
jgi:hypothetical protein